MNLSVWGENNMVTVVFLFLRNTNLSVLVIGSWHPRARASDLQMTKHLFCSYFIPSEGMQILSNLILENFCKLFRRTTFDIVSYLKTLILLISYFLEWDLRRGVDKAKRSYTQKRQMYTSHVTLGSMPCFCTNVDVNSSHLSGPGWKLKKLSVTKHLDWSLMHSQHS